MSDSPFLPIEVEVAATLLRRDYSLEQLACALNIPLKRAKALVAHLKNTQGVRA